MQIRKPLIAIVCFENTAHRLQSDVSSLWMDVGLRLVRSRLVGEFGLPDDLTLGLLLKLLLGGMRHIFSDSAASVDKGDFLFRISAMVS